MSLFLSMASVLRGMRFSIEAVIHMAELNRVDRRSKNSGIRRMWPDILVTQSGHGSARVSTGMPGAVFG